MKPALAFTSMFIALLLVSAHLFASPQQNAPTTDGLPRDPIIVSIEKARDEGRVADAEKIASDAVHQAEQVDPPSPQLASYLEELAGLLERKGRYSEAIALEQRALEINRDAFGQNDRSVEEDLMMMGNILGEQGNKDEAEQSFKQALDITQLNPDLTEDEKLEPLFLLSFLYSNEKRLAEAEQALLEITQGCKELKPNAAICQNSQTMLAGVYRDEGREGEAEQSQRLADVAWKPSELADLDAEALRYYKLGDYPKAEDAHNRAIAWLEKNPGANTLPLLSDELRSMGDVLERQSKNDEAEKAYLRMIDLEEQYAAAHVENPRGGSPLVDSNLFDDLIDLYRSEDRLTDAEPVIQHAIDMEEKLLGAQDSDVVPALVKLADLYQEEGDSDKTKYAQALPLYERALDIQQTNLGADHPGLVDVLTPYADLLRKMHQDAKAAEVQARIDALTKTQ